MIKKVWSGSDYYGNVHEEYKNIPYWECEECPTCDDCRHYFVEHSCEKAFTEDFCEVGDASEECEDFMEMEVSEYD